VLIGADLDVDWSERVAITGHSGAGKTTLLHILAGLERPESGRVLIDGVELQPRPAPGRIALVPQHHGLVGLLTAAENVELAMQAKAQGDRHEPHADRSFRTRRGAQDDLRERAARALAELGLAHRVEHLVDELSGGEQQRVAVARAVALGADIVLADEPTAELDAENRARVGAALKRLSSVGAVVIMTTHDEDVAASCDRVLRLRDGVLHE
jgi:putative ABC transport system ATP-binding protein